MSYVRIAVHVRKGPEVSHLVVGTHDDGQDVVSEVLSSGPIAWQHLVDEYGQRVWTPRYVKDTSSHARAAIMVDHNEKLLLWDDGRCGIHDRNSRQVLNLALSAAWPTWSVSWAARGEEQMYTHLNLDVTHVLPVRSAPTAWARLVRWQWEPGAEWSVEPPDLYGVGTGITSGADGFCSLSWEPGQSVCSDLLLGPDHFPWSDMERPGWDDPYRFHVTSDVSSSLIDPPQWGYHIDRESREVLWWSNLSVPLLPAIVRDVWQGWTVEWHEDNYEAHLDRAPSLAGLFTDGP